MTKLRIELLESIGFTWAKAKGDDCWYERFNELTEYKKLVGTYDCNVWISSTISLTCDRPFVSAQSL